MQATKPARLQSLPGYVLAQTFQVMRHALDCALRDLGLTAPQWGVLACIGEMGEVSGAEMARIHHKTPQTINTILHNLENMGLIAREHHPHHGTVLLVHLTDEGRERLSEATERVEALHAHMMCDLDDREQATLVDLLGRCTRSLQSGGAVAAPCLDEY